MNGEGSGKGCQVREDDATQHALGEVIARHSVSVGLAKIVQPVLFLFFGSLSRCLLLACVYHF